MVIDIFIPKMIDVLGDWILESIGGVRDSKYIKGVSQEYGGASDFWFRGIDNKRLSIGSTIKIKGIVSPYAPFTPGHPRARPGKNPAIWKDIEQMFSQFKENKRSPNSYSAFDSAIYGDGVTLVDTTSSNIVYVGVYDMYGMSDCSIPAFIDLKNDHLKKEWMKLSKPGVPSLIKGNVILFPSYYKKLGICTFECERYPCYGINVNSIKILKPMPHSLYADFWMTTNSGKFIDSYGDIIRNDDRILMIDFLSKEYHLNINNIDFIYDPTDIVPDEVPILNRRLVDFLEKKL